MDRELLIEIGCEEIPASWLPALTRQVANRLDARLAEARLETDARAESYSTPRRLTARVAKLAERQTDHEELVTGPPVSAAFKPEGGRERYLEYGVAVVPLLERAGGRVLFQGEAAPALLGGESWDLVLLVEYPTRRAFLEMIQSPEYQAIAHLRSEAITASELRPLEPGPAV